MKNIRYLFVLLFCAQFTACSDVGEKRAQELLKDPVMEEHIYKAIISDKQHLMKFMDKMMANENCRKMMIRHNAMMKMMCMSKEMDTLVSDDRELMEHMTLKMLDRMKRDSVVCDHTCSRMMENEHFRATLQKHAIQKKK